MPIPMQPVESSNLTAAGYDPATQVLAVQFKSGTLYTYSGVPPETYADFMAAESKGAFFAKSVRGQFEHSKVDPDAEDQSR